MEVTFDSISAWSLLGMDQAENNTKLVRNDFITPHSKGYGNGATYVYTPFNLFQCFINNQMVIYGMQLKARGAIVKAIEVQWKKPIEDIIFGKFNVEMSLLRLLDGRLMDVIVCNPISGSIDTSFPPIELSNQSFFLANDDTIEKIRRKPLSSLEIRFDKAIYKVREAIRSKRTPLFEGSNNKEIS